MTSGFAPLGRRRLLAGMVTAGLLPGIARAGAGPLPRRPWAVRIGGMVRQPQTYDLDRLLAAMPLEKRLYRYATDDGGALWLPWTGFALSHLIRLAEPLADARFVRFTSAPDHQALALPHREGLRLDEALHPLTLLATELHGHALTAADGGPLRLVVPWKYGYKSAGSLTAIDFVRHQPLTAATLAHPSAARFFGNVRAHGPFAPGLPAQGRHAGTALAFNGYANDVAFMYNSLT